MSRIGSLVQQDWQDTREGKELVSSILRRNRRRLFGLIDYPNTPLSLKTKDVSFKIFLLGKAGVGKTSLISKLVGREVPVNHAETPGIQMSTVYWPAKLIQSQQIVMFKLEFWDAGEQCLKKFDHILPACKDGADAVLYVFNLANKATWEDLQPLITRSEINNNVTNELLQIAVGTRADQKIAIDSARERFRDFEKVWKIQILQIANVDAPKLPDGKFLDGRVGIRDIAPFLNRLVELLWEHKNERTSGVSAVTRPLPQRNERVNASPALPEKQKRKNEASPSMDFDDEINDRSSTSSGIENRRSAVSYSATARPLPQRKGRDAAASSTPEKTTRNTSEKMSVDDDNDDRSSTTSSAVSRRSAAGFSARPQLQRVVRDRDNTSSPKPDKSTRKTTDKMSIDGDDDDRSSTTSSSTGRKSAAGFAVRPSPQKDETTLSTSERLTRKSVSSGRMSVDDDFDDKSSTTTSSSNSRRSGEKLTITYC